jgi:predicted nucleic acid-binding protein
MLLDTSGLLAVQLRSEPQHAKAARLYRTARRRLTHGYVLSELVPLAQVRGVQRADVLEFAAGLIDDPDIDVVWVDEALHREGLALLAARPDKNYSLCDAVSFVLMRQARMTDALTTDRHFEQEGFVRLLT